MPSFLDCCQNFYGTKDLYELLQIKKDASDNEVKKAYRKLSLLVHPDRVSEEDKENATEKFKTLGKAYSIISDSEKRKVYDETGCVDDDDEDGLQDRDWTEYWRSLFKEINLEDIEEYEKQYKNSEEEVKDLVNAYKNGKGSMDYIFDHVPFSQPTDEDRLRSILEDLINKGELKSFRAFTHESQEKRDARKRKWEKEAKAAEKAKKEIQKKKSKKSQSEDLGEVDLMTAIMQRNKEREANADALFRHLEESYCKPKAKGRKSKK